MLSIIIPSHNRADLLTLCLGTVTRHAPPGVEIIVVDDASPAGAVTRAAQLFPTVQVTRLPRRGGFCRAVNAGIAASRGEIVELLNDDTEVAPAWAESAVDCFKQESVGAVAPLVLQWPNGDTVDSAGDRYYLGGVAGKRGHGRPLSPSLLRSTVVFGASASSAFYRREALRKIGGFPESFGSYFEDVDVAFRLRRAGYQTIYEPRARVFHRVSASHGSLSRRLVQQQSRNEERVFWRNLPSATLLRALPKHAAVLVGKAWRRWQEGTLTPFLFGRLQCVREISSILRHRQSLRQLDGVAAEPLIESAYWGDREGEAPAEP